MYQFKTRDGKHSIQFSQVVTRFPTSDLPEETTRALRAQMHRFPMGQLYSLDRLRSLEPTTITLFYDAKYSAFFAASIEDIFDLWAKHLDSINRATQQKRMRAQYYKARRLKRQGARA